jgi:hypothetical protein
VRRRRALQVLGEDAPFPEAALGVERDEELGAGERERPPGPVAVDPGLRLPRALAGEGLVVEPRARRQPPDLLGPAEERQHLAAARLGALLVRVGEELVGPRPGGADGVLELVGGGARARVAPRPEDALELETVLLVAQLLQEGGLLRKEEQPDELREAAGVDLLRGRRDRPRERRHDREREE